MHPTIDPDAITDALGISPERAWRVGDARVTPIGTPLEGRYRETYWYVDLLASDEGTSTKCAFDDRLSSLLADLERHAAFIAALRDGGGRAELFVGLYGDRNFGFVLPALALQRLGAIGLDLSLDIYPHRR